MTFSPWKLVVRGSPQTAQDARAKLEWPLAGGFDMVTISLKL
jgi:hypothetical protein